MGRRDDRGEQGVAARGELVARRGVGDLAKAVDQSPSGVAVEVRRAEVVLPAVEAVGVVLAELGESLVRTEVEQLRRPQGRPAQAGTGRHRLVDVDDAGDAHVDQGDGLAPQRRLEPVGDVAGNFA